MIECNCGRIFESKNGFASHRRKCTEWLKYNTETKKIKITDNYKLNDVYICECNKEFTTALSLSVHFSHCTLHKNLNSIKSTRIYVTKGGHMNGWKNKSDDEIKNIHKKTGLTLKEKYNNNELKHPWKNRKHNNLTKEKISIGRTNYLENHSTTTKWYEISNGEKLIKVQGTWEKNLGEWLTNNQIKWDRHKILFDGHRRYTPDFYLTEFNFYIEVKGFMKDTDIIKMKKVIEEKKIIIKLFQIQELKLLKKNEFNLDNLTNFK